MEHPKKIEDAPGLMSHALEAAITLGNVSRQIRPAFKGVLTAPHTARVAPWASMRYPRSEVQCVHVAEILTVRGNL